MIHVVVLHILESSEETAACGRVLFKHTVSYLSNNRRGEEISAMNYIPDVLAHCEPSNQLRNRSADGLAEMLLKE